MAMLLTYLFQGRPEAAPLNPIARYTWVFPWVESAHICGFGLLVGTAFVLSMRLMGVWFKNQSISKLAKQLSPWILTGLTIMLITGPYLLSSDAREYVQVPAFKVKMALLALAIVFHFVIVRRATDSDKDALPLGWRKLAGAVSLGLWMGVVVGGLWIGNL
jgi:hypothetical protein